MTRILALAVLWLAASSVSSRPFDPGFFQSPVHWPEGKAEITLFDGIVPVDGIPRVAEFRQIISTGHFGPMGFARVDPDRKPESYRVLQWQLRRSMSIGTIEHNQALQLSWRAADSRLLRLVEATFDAEGIRYQQGNRLLNTLYFRSFSDLPGMEEVTSKTDLPADVLFYDELPLLLRSLRWQTVRVFEAPLLPSWQGQAADAQESGMATFAISSAEDAYTVRVDHAHGQDVFTFAIRPPHELIQWHRFDGTILHRRHMVLIPYPSLRAPGDEIHLFQR